MVCDGVYTPSGSVVCGLRPNLTAIVVLLLWRVLKIDTRSGLFEQQSNHFGEENSSMHWFGDAVIECLRRKVVVMISKDCLKSKVD